MKFYGRFDEPIYQDYGHHDGNLVINPRDWRATILDFGENEDPDVRKKRIENVVTRFLVDVGRIKANDLLTWQDVIDLVKQEPEHLVKKNIKFEDILPDFEYWTRDGKVARMIILKPAFDEHFDNIYRWEVHMAYDGFVDNWRVGSVFEFLDDDRYLIAWYALWRKWPMQYKAWEWAGKFQEVRNASKGPNYCKHFKDLYMEEINSGKLILKQSDWKWSWQGYHRCMWDKFGMYNMILLS